MNSPYILADHVQPEQDQPEGPANLATDKLDRKENQRAAKAITGNTSFTSDEVRQNHVVELTGTPGAAFTVDMPSGVTQIVLEVLNSTDSVATIRNSVAAGSNQPVLQPGDFVRFRYDGTNFLARSWVHDNVGTMPLSLGALREIATNDVPNTAADAGVLSSDTSPSYARVNLATDKALRVNWAAGNVDEVQFPPVFMPPDLDASRDLTIHLLADMSGATDTPTIDVQVFDGVGDTEMGSATQTVTATLAEKTVTIAAADVSGHPLGFLNISLVPGTHATDALRVYAAWIEYRRLRG